MLTAVIRGRSYAYHHQAFSLRRNSFAKLTSILTADKIDIVSLLHIKNEIKLRKELEC